jgi:hypothetical protein
VCGSRLPCLYFFRRTALLPTNCLTSAASAPVTSEALENFDLSVSTADYLQPFAPSRWAATRLFPFERTAAYGDTFQTSTSRQPLPAFATTPPMSHPGLHKAVT